MVYDNMGMPCLFIFMAKPISDLHHFMKIKRLQGSRFPLIEESSRPSFPCVNQGSWVFFDPRIHLSRLRNKSCSVGRQRTSDIFDTNALCIIRFVTSLHDSCLLFNLLKGQFFFSHFSTPPGNVLDQCIFVRVLHVCDVHT